MCDWEFCNDGYDVFKVKFPVLKKYCDRNNRLIFSNNEFLNAKVRQELINPRGHEPHELMPIEISVEACVPVPKGKPYWFTKAANNEVIPCVTSDGWKFIYEVVVPAMFAGDFIRKTMQIHAISFKSKYSKKPYIKIEIKSMFQNIGMIKEEIGVRVRGRKDDQGK